MKSLLLALSLLAFLVTAPATVSAAPPTKGDLVLAVWGPDGLYYPARVASADGDKIRVAYYDGDVAEVPSDRVRAFNWKVGTVVQCNWKNGGKYYGGKIAEMEGEAIFIHYDDGDKELAGIGRCRSK